MKRLIRMIILTCFTLCVLIVASYAWFTNTELVEPKISGYSVAAYFGGGDGSAEHPFEIKNKRHLYNLAWLQYLGYFNKYGVDNVPDENQDQPTSSSLTQYYFIVDNDINMNGWALPPIGTSTNPFIGFLDGNGKVISNLNTTNDFEDFGSKHPSSVNKKKFANCEIIGFMGSIGETSSMEKTGTIDEDANAVCNFVLSGTTVITNEESSLIGSVAGYVNGTLQNIGVKNAKLTFNNSTNPFEDYVRVSEYSVVGYAEDQYITQKTQSSSYAYTPTYDYTVFNFKGMGDQSEWGGSMDMQKLYTRTKNLTNNNGTTNPKYTDMEIRKPVDGKTYDRFDASTYSTTSRHQSNNTYTKYYDSSSTSGAYLKDYLSNTNEAYQQITTLYKEVYFIEKDTSKNGGDAIGYKFHDENGHYLSYNKSQNSLISTTSSDTATIWLLDSTGLYTYNDTVYSEDIAYYLNGTTELINNLSTTSSTQWTWNDTYNTLKYTYQSEDYYLKYFNGAWTVKKLYCIKDDNGHYLGFDGTNVKNYDSESINTAWEFLDNGRIRNTDGRYLGLNNGNLQIGTTQTQWIKEEGAIYYSGYYIQYDTETNNWITNRPRNLYITYDLDGTTHYLTFNYNNNGNPTLVDTTNKANATIWTFQTNNGNPSGTISYVYQNGNNSTTYYIRYNNQAMSLSSNNSTSWSNDGAGLYSNGYYMIYDKSSSSWKLSNTRQFYIYQEVAGVKHYLSLNGANIIDRTTESQATLWNFATFNADNPYGRIYSGNYYLYLNNGLLATTTIQNSGTQWTNSGSGINYNGSYIQYLNGLWISGNLNYIYQEQEDGTKKYLSTSNGTSLRNEYNAIDSTPWVFTNYNSGTPQGYIYTVYNGTIKYLYYNNGLTLNTSGTNWTNSGTYIYNGSNYLGLDDWEKAFTISYNNYYLTATSATRTGSTQTASAATLWYVNENNHIYTYYNGTKVFLYCGGSTATVYLQTSETGLINYKSGNQIILSTGNSNYRLYYYRGGGWRYGASNYNLTWNPRILSKCEAASNSIPKTKLLKNSFELANSVAVSECILSIENDDVNTYYYKSTKSIEPSIYNYIPINANSSSPYSIATNNTGYIMAGGYEGENQTDIRISQFTKDTNVGWGIRGSFNNGSWDTNKIYTVGTNGVGVIKDTTGSTSGVVYDNTNNNNLLFKKLKTSKETLQTTLNNSGDYVYGLHFMDARISKEHLIQPAEVFINGEPKYNYQMPEDCIDFHLKSSGIINFFSGYYYASRNDTETPDRRNDAFFSLHEIIRDDNDRITQIRHILQVYEKDGQYIYKYVDDDDSSINGYYMKGDNDQIVSKSASDINGWTLKFDYNWIEDPENSTKNANNPIVWSTHRTCVFYFEIPVHKGEYALGSVDGKNGTYLIYLDIGANAALVDRTKVSQVTENTTEKVNYVNGIQIMDSNDSIYINPTSYDASQIYYERTGNGTEASPYVYNRLTILSEADYNSHSSNIWIMNINERNSAVAYITIINSEGDIDISRTNNSISIGSSLSSTYCGTGITLNCTMDVSRVVKTTNILKLLDYNRNTKKTYQSTVEFDSITANNSTNSSKTYNVIDMANPSTIITNNNTTDANIEAGTYGLLTDDGETIYNTRTTYNSNTVPQFNTNVTMSYYGFTSSNIDTTNDILAYNFEVNTYKQNVTPKQENAFTEVIEVDIIEDSTSHTVTKTLDNQLTTVQLEKAYKVGGDTVTITSTETADINVTNADTNYTFVINGTTVSTNSTVQTGAYIAP